MATAFKKISKTKDFADKNVEGGSDDDAQLAHHKKDAEVHSDPESEKGDSAMDMNEETPATVNPVNLEEELSVFKDADPLSK